MEYYGFIEFILAQRKRNKTPTRNVPVPANRLQRLKVSRRSNPKTPF